MKISIEECVQIMFSKGQYQCWHGCSFTLLYDRRPKFTFHIYHKIFGEIGNLIISEITFIYWIFGFPVNRSDYRALLEDERESVLVLDKKDGSKQLTHTQIDIKMHLYIHAYGHKHTRSHTPRHTYIDTQIHTLIHACIRTYKHTYIY